MPKQSYSEKLLDPRWQKKRLDILERDGFTCRNCGAKDKTLHVHHFIYEKNPWETENCDLMTLCEKCHGKIERMWKLLLKAASEYLNTADLLNTSVFSKTARLATEICDMTAIHSPSGICNDSANNIIKLTIDAVYNHKEHKCKHCSVDAHNQ